MTELALQALILALSHATELSNLISTSRAEGRDVTVAELDALRATYDTKKSDLQAEIDRQRG